MAKRKRSRAVETDVAPDRPLRLRRALSGFVLGFLLWIAAVQFLVGMVRHVADDWTYPLFGLLGAAVGVTRFRKLLWTAAAFVVLLFLVLGYTPLVSWVIRGWVRSDALQKAPAVVVLAADGDEGLEITEKGQARVLHGYEVVQQGYASLLVVSRGASDESWVPAVKRQMGQLGIEAPVEETKGVHNTHDEALAVAEMARAQGWDRVILVTHPLHMRRSMGVFEKAGVRVIASPCTEWRYNLDDLGNMPSRITALREWLHEWLGCVVYRRRGWME